MAFCENCGTKLEDGAKFCPKCGNPTDSTQSNAVADNESGWSVELSALLEGSSKLEIVKVLMKELGMGINDTKNLVESAPCILSDGLSFDAAKELAQKLQAMGATVNIKSGVAFDKSYSKPKVQEQSTNQFESNTEKSSKSGCWKKILYTFLALSLIGFFGEKCGNQTDRGNGEQDSIQQTTEQVAAETEEAVEADDAVCNTIAQDVEEQPSELSSKEKEIADAGAHQGTLFGMAGANNEGFSDMLDAADYIEGINDKVDEMFKEMAGGEYDKQYGAPANAEEERLKEIYIEHFIKAMNNTMDAMDNMEKLGGKQK